MDISSDDGSNMVGLNLQQYLSFVSLYSPATDKKQRERERESKCNEESLKVSSRSGYEGEENVWKIGKVTKTMNSESMRCSYQH